MKIFNKALFTATTPSQISARRLCAYDCVTKPSTVIMLATSSSQNVGADLEGSATARNTM